MAGFKPYLQGSTSRSVARRLISFRWFRDSVVIRALGFSSLPMIHSVMSSTPPRGGELWYRSVSMQTPTATIRLNANPCEDRCRRRARESTPGAVGELSHAGNAEDAGRQA